MFRGSIVAVVTPFKDDVIDEDRIKRLVEFHVKAGTDAILPCGTTGESPTLSFEEHERVIELTIQAAGGKIPVIAGTGSNSTKEAITLTKHAATAGADACLLVAPYYNRPTQEGLYQHIKAIAESVDIPIILYNIPSRCGVNILPETVARLAGDCKNIVGIKEASGSLDQMSQIKAACPEEFALLSGDDSLTLAILSIGGVGVISVVANIVPGDVKMLIKAYQAGQAREAFKIHYRLLPLVKAMFIETNPIPVKTAMGLLDMCSPQVRLPLSGMTEENVRRLKRVLTNYGLLK
jgi:4-hydroxy-tetrahydrodipicolinate synthase